jgi:hypothetical protein
MANGEMATIKKIGTNIGVIIGIITILTSGYYFVSDRFTVVAQVNQGTMDNVRQDKEIEMLRTEFRQGAAERNKKIDDLIFNQKRMMEKLGIKWQPFRDEVK